MWHISTAEEFGLSAISQFMGGAFFVYDILIQKEVIREMYQIAARLREVKGDFIESDLKKVDSKWQMIPQGYFPWLDKYSPQMNILQWYQLEMHWPVGFSNEKI